MNTPSAAELQTVLITPPIIIELMPVDTDFIGGYYQYTTILQHYAAIHTEVDLKRVSTLHEEDILMQ